MEVTAHCLTLMLLIIILLSGFNIHTSALRIVPTKLQLFQYESVSFHCEGLDGSDQLRGIRSTEGFLSVCDFKDAHRLSCSIDRAYRTDSGEYWCESEGGERSNTVSITVTAASVILDSPVLPVMEGDCVTLGCRTKTTSSNIWTFFYKDGLLMANSSTGQTTIHSVSKSDEGLYKCNISEVGESPQSCLTVRELHTDTSSSSDHFIRSFLVLQTVVAIAMVALLLLPLGLVHCGKHRDAADVGDNSSLSDTNHTTKCVCVEDISTV